MRSSGALNLPGRLPLRTIMLQEPHTHQLPAQAEGQLHTHGGQARTAMRQFDLLQGFSKDPLGFFDHLLDAQLQDIRCAADLGLPYRGSCFVGR